MEILGFEEVEIDNGNGGTRTVLLLDLSLAVAEASVNGERLQTAVEVRDLVADVLGSSEYFETLRERFVEEMNARADPATDFDAVSLDIVVEVISAPTPSPTPSQTATPTPSVSSSPTSSPTASTTSSATPSPSATSSATPSTTATATPTPSSTSSATPTPSTSPSATPSASASPSASPVVISRGLYVGGYMTSRVERLQGPLLATDGTSWVEDFDNLLGGIDAMIEYNGDLIVGGTLYLKATNQQLHCLMRWDPSSRSWNAFGGGVNSGVLALMVDGDELVAGGGFTIVNTLGLADSPASFPANRIASFNGTSWSAFGPGLSGSVRGMCRFRGDLIAIGAFSKSGDNARSLNSIGRWDGTSWGVVGVSSVSPGFDNLPMTMTVYNGDLYVSGFFSTIDQLFIPRIAKYDGSNWSAVGRGLDNFALLQVFDGLLYAAGGFTRSDSVVLLGVATWDGSAWSPAPFIQGSLSGAGALKVFNDTLVFGMQNAKMGETSVNFLGALRDGQLSSFAGGVQGSVVNMCSWNNTLVVFGGNIVGVTPSSGDRVIVVQPDGSEAVTGLAGPSWGSQERVESLSFIDGTLYAGGYFPVPISGSSDVANSVARLGANGWEPLPNRDGFGVQGTVFAFMRLDNGSVLIGGSFNAVGNRPSKYIALWDGVVIHPIADAGFNSQVFNFPKVAGEQYATGYFTQVNVDVSNPVPDSSQSFANPNTANCVAKWTGSGWAPVPGWGFDNLVAGLVEFNGDIIAFGGFDTANLDSWVYDCSQGCVYNPIGLPSEYLARWNGTTWSTIGSTADANYPTNWVYSAVVFNGRLYTSGSFGVRSWDGSVWTTATGLPAGARFDGTMVVWNDGLYASGTAGAFAVVYKLNTATNGWESALDGFWDQRVKVIAAV